MRFSKMHGIGNDYVYVDCFDAAVDRPDQLAQKVSDRHFGIGADGLILICPSNKADVQMRMFNADGSESEMCGNGVRCVAKYAFEHRLVKSADGYSHNLHLLQTLFTDAESYREITVETGSGVLPVGVAIWNDRVEQVCVNMGEPILEPGDIPVNVVGQQVVGVPITVLDQTLIMTCVSMGNPHAVFYCDDVASVDLEQLGPLVEHHAMFPQRINAHFVQRVSDNEIIMRTWERGSGITLACGTGASAVCVAGVVASKTNAQISAHLPGGNLNLQWNQQDNCVYMIGTATEVYSGQWPDH